MRNLVLGILIGVAAGWLYFLEIPTAWYVWILFAAGSGLIVFGFDVFSGSMKEHETRAAWMGFGFFAGSGLILLLIAFGFGIY